MGTTYYNTHNGGNGSADTLLISLVGRAAELIRLKSVPGDNRYLIIIIIIIVHL